MACGRVMYEKQATSGRCATNTGRRQWLAGTFPKWVLDTPCLVSKALVIPT